MKYHYLSRDAKHPVLLVRRAAKQAKSFAVLATEQPSGERRQVLLMVGKEGREKIPILIGEDASVRNIVGSALVRTQADRLVGVLAFATDSQAQATRDRYERGELILHLITRPIAGVELMHGETLHWVAGPAVVLTRWEPLQIILGAD